MKINMKSISYIILGMITVISWNVFLIQRDNKMFERYQNTTITKTINV